MKNKNKNKINPPKTPWRLIALIALLGFLVYANTLQGPFLFDDEQLVLHNYFLRGWQHITDVFTTSINQGAGRLSSFYRPVQIISYALDRSVWKLNVIGYHLTNIAWHLTTAIFLFWLFRILFQDTTLSFIASLLFVVHPVHTEAISYISGRADPLSAAFLLLTLILYCKLLRNNRPAFFFAMLAAYALALLSRESAIILPLLALLIHYVFPNKFRWRFFGPLLGLTALYIILRFTALRALLDPTPCETTFLQRVPGFFSALTTYMRLLICPFNLHMEYGAKTFPFTDPRVISGIILFLSTIIAAFRLRRSFPPASFSIFWFYLALLPSTNLYPINAYMAEHWLYLPSAGFFLLVALGFRALVNGPSLKKISVVLLALLVIFYAALTIRQNTTWLDPQAFYERTLTFAPNSSACYTNLGRIYEKSGLRDQAIAAFEKAIEIDPRRSNSYSNLAVIYSGMGQHDEAISLFEKAVGLSPHDAKLWSNLGAAYSEAGKVQAAIRALRKALEINPNLAGSCYNLAILYERTGQKQEAAELMEKMREIDPDFKAERVLERVP